MNFRASKRKLQLPSEYTFNLKLSVCSFIHNLSIMTMSNLPSCLSNSVCIGTRMQIVQSQTKFGRASSLTSHTGSDTDSSNLLTTDKNNQFCLCACRCRVNDKFCSLFKQDLCRTTPTSSRNRITRLYTICLICLLATEMPLALHYIQSGVQTSYTTYMHVVINLRGVMHSAMSEIIIVI